MNLLDLIDKRSKTIHTSALAEHSGIDRAKVETAAIEALSGRGIDPKEFKHKYGYILPRAVAIEVGAKLSPSLRRAIADAFVDMEDTLVSISNHRARAMRNRLQVPKGYFTVIGESSELPDTVQAMSGYDLPAEDHIDISIGKGFSAHMGDSIEFVTYNHKYPDGRVVKARAYPYKYLGDFREYLDIWRTTKAPKYLKKKNPEFLMHIKILENLNEN